jgi:hypothetical protein
VTVRYQQEAVLIDATKPIQWPSNASQPYLQCAEMPPLLGLRALTEVGRDLLRPTAELPDSEQGLLAVLIEYRYAVYAFAATADKICA